MQSFACHKVACVALALASLAAPGFAAARQESVPANSGGAVTAQRDGVPIRIQAPGGVTWTGRVKQQNGKFQEVPPATAGELRKRLARIQVAVDVDRDLEGAVKELEELRLTASRVGYAERLPVLVEIALSLAQTLDALGRREEAISAASPPLLPVHIDPGTTFELENASEGERAALAKAAEDPRLLALRARWKQAAAAPAGGGQSLDEIVRGALARNDFPAVLDLGERALPALERAIAEDLENFPGWSADPLRTLIEINCGRAGEFVRAHIDDGGPVWKARVIRALKAHVISGTGAIYGQYDDHNHPTIRFPEWIGVLERILDDPATRGEALELVKPLVPRDLLSTGLQQRLVTFLGGADAALAAMAKGTVEGGAGRPTTFPIYEAALRSPHADVRSFAALRLVEYKAPGALLASFESPDPVVRSAAASALRTRNVAVPNYPANAVQWREFTPLVTAAQRATLERLLADPESSVRAEAAESILELPTAVGEATYARIAGDADARVRVQLLFSAAAPVSLRAQCALSLASNTDPAVLQPFDRFVFEVLAPQIENEAWTVKAAFLPALRARRANTVLPFGATGGEEARLTVRMARTGAGLSELIRWALVSRDGVLNATVRNGLSLLLGKDSPIPFRQRPPQGPSLAAAGLDVSPAELAEYFAVAWDPKSDPWRTVSALSRLSDDLAPSFLKLARDAKRDLPLRLGALDVAARGPGEQVAACLLDLLAAPGWKAALEAYPAHRHVVTIAEALQGEPAERTLAALLADTRILPVLASAYVEGHARSRPLDAATADKVLARWYDERSASAEALLAALKQVATRPRAQQGDWLVRAVRDTRFWRTTLELMGELKDPSYLDVLAACLEQGYAPEYGHGDPSGARELPLDALTRYFDDAAAAVILETAGKTASSKLREQCFAALETIRKYQAEKGRWDDSRVSREAIAAAVRDLLVLLEDANPAVRAQAVKALGTLRAIEQMPRIVRLLKDSDASVRGAATEALEVLNRPPAKQD